MPAQLATYELNRLTKLLKEGKQMATAIVQGSLIKVTYAEKDFEAIVIDPNGLGKGQPTVGLGFRMMHRHAGLPQQTISDWLEGDREREGLRLKLPSGKALNVTGLIGENGNEYLVLEIADWVELAADVAKKSRVKKATKDKLIDFLAWFATKGFYAECYTALKGAYTDKDSRATSRWLNARASGVPVRKAYTDLLQAQGCTAFEYANWTSLLYTGLFGIDAKAMKAQWAVVAGCHDIARNHISEAEGLEAVKFCEDMVARMFIDDLKDAHQQAIALTVRKFPALRGEAIA